MSTRDRQYDYMRSLAMAVTVLVGNNDDGYEVCFCSLSMYTQFIHLSNLQSQIFCLGATGTTKII